MFSSGQVLSFRGALQLKMWRCYHLGNTYYLAGLYHSGDVIVSGSVFIWADVITSKTIVMGGGIIGERLSSGGIISPG
jgi:hypothetical protein